MQRKIMKSVKVDLDCTLKAKELKMSVNQYLKYLIHLSGIGRREFEYNHMRRLENLEVLFARLTKEVENKAVSERTLVIKLERDLAQVIMYNKQLHELILAKFEFINALEKAIKSDN